MQLYIQGILELCLETSRWFKLYMYRLMNCKFITQKNVIYFITFNSGIFIVLKDCLLETNLIWYCIKNHTFSWKLLFLNFVSKRHIFFFKKTLTFQKKTFVLSKCNSGMLFYSKVSYVDLVECLSKWSFKCENSFLFRLESWYVWY